MRRKTKFGIGKFNTLFAVSLSVSLVFVSNVINVEASSGQEIGIFVNSEEVLDSDKPFIKDGKTYVPIRVIGDLLGVEVGFNNKTKIVTVENSNMNASFQVGNIRYKVNREEFSSDAEPLIKSNRVYVPLRVVSEVFGAEVSYDNKNDSILINFKSDKCVDNNADKLTEKMSEFFNISEKQVSSLSKEELELYTKAYYDLLSSGTNKDTIKSIQNDTVSLLNEIVTSEEFQEFKAELQNSKEFKEQLISVFNSDLFKIFVDDVLNSSEYKVFVEEVRLQSEYVAFVEEFKKHPSFNSLVNKYGEDVVINPLLISNSTTNAYIDVINLLVQDNDYTEFLVASTNLKSYPKYQQSIINLINSPKYSLLRESVNRNFNGIYTEFETIILESISTIPETKALMKLYENGTKEIYSKYGLR